MRMYQQDSQRYQIRAPWESQELRPVKPMVKTFQKPEYIVRNQDLSAREVKTILPAIGSSQEMSEERTRILTERLGALLYSSRPEVINRIKKDFQASDPLNQGKVMNNSLLETLANNNVALDENAKKMLIQKFDPRQSGRCNYGEVMSFLADALAEFKIQRDKSEFTNLPRFFNKSKVQHPSMNSSEFILGPIAKKEPPDEEYVPNPGVYSKMKLNHAFVERRDAGLRLEVERCFQDYRGQTDVHYMVSNMKKELLRREDDIIGPYKLKGIVTRYQLPLNVALVDKLIERLDPMGTGHVSCSEFVKFLEKALPLPSGFNGSGESFKRGKSRTRVPEKPSWETNKPLKAIKTNHSRETTRSEDSINGREFERFMKLVTALRRHSNDAETLSVEDARQTILKYNALFSLGLTHQDIDVTLRKCERDGLIEVDDVIDGLGILEGV